MKKRILAVVMTATLAASVMLTGCGGGDKKGATDAGKGQANVQANGTLNLDLPEIKSLDSAQGQDVASFTPINAAFEGLARVNDGKLEPAGSTWKVSEDGKTYTFTLKDFNWSDGKAVTAKDFEYSWRRLVNPATKAPYGTFLNGIVKNAEKISAGKAKPEELGVTAKDDKTLVVELERQVPYFLEMVAFPSLYPVREDVVKAQGDKYGTDPTKMVFNGPFVVTDWQKGAKMTLKKNDKYYDAAAVKLGTVTLQDIKELQTKYQMFTAKQLDAIPGTGEYAQKLKDDAAAGKIDFREAKQPSSFYMMFNMNGKNKLLTNKNIRLALSLAIDRDAYVNKIYKRGYVSYGLVPDVIKCGDKNYRAEVQEPLKAVIDQKKDPKALFVQGLKELGLNPDPSKYTLKYLGQGNTAFDKQSGEFYQNQWQTKLGIKIVLESPASFSDYLVKAQAGEFEIATSGWGADYNDPDSFISLFQKDNGNNHSKYYNPKYEDILKKLAAETDSAKRVELFKQAEQLLVVEDAGIAPTFYKDLKAAKQKYVQGIQYPAFGPNYELKWAYVEGK
ncbi:peptide ABC transporter substrate-binding protein [Clostridium sp. JNZ J1-5]